MATSPRLSKLLTSPSTVVWSSGETFDGYIILTLSLPTGYTKHSLKNSLTPLVVPTTTRVPVIEGIVDPDTGLYYNADVNPPGTHYTGSVYDVSGVLIASIAGSITISAEQTTLTIPTLTTPV